LRKPTRFGHGWMRVDAYLTRAGVFHYRLPDGKVRRELRPAEEVFKQDSLDSFASLPVTDGHPSDAMVDAANCRKVAVGVTGETLRQDGQFVAGSMVLMDPGFVESLGSREKAEVSCGYVCELEETPGEWQGERYDAVQRNIRGNHVAIVERGRAGPEVRVRLDASDAEQFEPSSKTEPGGTTVSTKRIKLDGVDFEGPESMVQAFEREQSRADAALKEATAEKEKLSARVDAATEQAKKNEAALKEATDPARLRAVIAARVALESQARSVLGSQVKLDGMDERAIKVAVLAKLTPESKLDGKSEEYVHARFDIAMEEHEEENVGLDAVRAAEGRADADSSSGMSPEKIVETARAKMLKENAALWKKPLSASKQ
jgi:hypothetical protein